MRTVSKIQSISLLVLLACLFIAHSGCGGTPDPFDLVQIDGTIKYEDGSLIQADRILIHFKPLAEPIDPKTFPPMGFAEVNVADGTFGDVSSRGFQNGLVPGRHKITIEVFGGEIPTRYASSELTPLEIDTANPPFDLTITKK